MERRKFIKDIAKTGILVSAAGSVPFSSFAAYKTTFDQAPLPYEYAALEPMIDTRTMEIHYTKHAAAYSANLKDAVKAEGVTATTLEPVLANISKYSAKMRNNGGGHFNHEMFWQCMKPNGGGTPNGKLGELITRDFGSFEAMKTQFTDAGKNRFGSGWAWLYADKGKLKIGSTPNQDNPLMDISEIKGMPLLALDVWEHAYYLKYQNKRADYIENWWKLVNWEHVQQRLPSSI